jgi:integrase
VEGLKMRANLKLVKSAPTVEKQRVGGRKSDAAYGRDGQKYLTPDLAAALIKMARQNTYGLRDALMISLTYHLALRVSELVGMRWNAVDWKRGDIAVNRLKGSKSNRQPLNGNDLRALRALYRDRASDEWIFMGDPRPAHTRWLQQASEGRCRATWTA